MWVQFLAFLCGCCNPALPQAVGQVTFVAQIWFCCGCGIDLRCNSLAWELPYAADAVVKRKKEKKKNKSTGLVGANEKSKEKKKNQEKKKKEKKKSKRKKKKKKKKKAK